MVLSQDTVLFEAIISDLFPNTQPMEPDQQLLTTALADACEVIGLQPVPHLIDKAKQLHDTLGVRFGVMLVGPAGRDCSLLAMLMSSNNDSLGCPCTQQRWC